MVRAGVNLGLSGAGARASPAPRWGGDIGGFHCNARHGFTRSEDGELLTRWIQMGSMSSNIRT